LYAISLGEVKVVRMVFCPGKTSLPATTLLLQRNARISSAGQRRKALAPRRCVAGGFLAVEPRKTTAREEYVNSPGGGERGRKRARVLPAPDRQRSSARNRGGEEVTTKLLIVDDDRDFASSLSLLLDSEGFATRCASSGEQALDAARAWQPDVILLDVVLPGLDGLSVCHALRRESSAAIIMLTALDAEVDRVVGLEVGADDYVTKPFSHRELSARIRAVLRRTQGGRSTETNLVSGDLELRFDSRKVYLRGQPVDLTLKEFELLATFVRQTGRALSRDELYGTVWAGAPAEGSRTLDAHIRSLREKIEADPANPTRIVTLRRVGYRFEG